MRYRTHLQGWRVWPLLTASLTLLLAAHSSLAGEDSGQAERTPWSGYWWPHREGRILGPLSKYDQLTGKAAAAWERKQHPAGPEVPSWHGYCHAWAASAVREPEPAQARVAQAGSRQASLAIGDQKGLLSLTHAHDDADSYGDRLGDGRGSEDPSDLAPDQLWQLLKLYIRQQRIPLVLDIEAGSEVWNFPAYAYKISYSPHGENNQQLAQLTVWFADDFVAPDYVGVKVRRQTYWFTFQLQGNKIVAGSGKWHGPSVKDHPDFAWFPTVQRAENPELDYSQVRHFVGRPVAGSSPPTTNPPTTPPTNPPTTPPTTPPAPPVDPDNPPPPTPGPGGSPTPGTTTPPGPNVAQSTRPMVLSPWELLGLVANKTSAFPLDISVDRFDGGQYEIGESIVVSGSSGKAGYLYLLHLSGQGELSLLYPQPGQDNRVKAGEKFTIPGPKDAFAFVAEPPVGVGRIKAVVTTRPLQLSGLTPSQSIPSQVAPGQDYPKPEQSKPKQKQPKQEQGKPNQDQAKPKPEQAKPEQSKPGQEQIKPKPEQVKPKQDQGQPAQEQTKPEQAQRKPAPARIALQLQKFLWPPSQLQQIQQLLAQYQRDDSLSQEEFGRLEPRKYLGEFAQDEVAFYVGFATSPPKQPAEQTQEKPKSKQSSDQSDAEPTRKGKSVESTSGK